MIKTEQRNIDGMEVRTTQLPALKGFSLFTKLGKLLGPVLEKLGALGDLEKLITKDVSALGPALTALFGQLEGKEAEKFAMEVLSSTTVEVTTDDGRTTIVSLCDANAINRAFGGNVMLMIKVMRFALEVNYADFFAGGLVSAQAKALAGTEKP